MNERERMYDHLTALGDDVSLNPAYRYSCRMALRMISELELRIMEIGEAAGLNEEGLKHPAVANLTLCAVKTLTEHARKYVPESLKRDAELARANRVIANITNELGAHLLEKWHIKESQEEKR